MSEGNLLNKALIKDDSKFPDIPVEGIHGYYWLDGPDRICVPWVASLDPGKGNFSKAIKWLEDTGRDVIFINIISPLVRDILVSKGYRETGIAMPDGPICALIKENHSAKKGGKNVDKKITA